MINLKNIKPVSYIKENFSKVLDDIEENGATYVITKNGEARAVIVDIEAYERDQKAEVLRKLLAIADKDIAEGRVMPAEEAFGKLFREFGHNDLVKKYGL